MRSTRKELCPNPIDREEWHDWFAWHPIRVFEGTNNKYYRWVWLETVKRKLTFCHDGMDSFIEVQYRVLPYVRM